MPHARNMIFFSIYEFKTPKLKSSITIFKSPLLIKFKHATKTS